MCVVSAITDYGQRIWPDPWVQPSGVGPRHYPAVRPNGPNQTTPFEPASKQDLEALASQMREFMETIKAAEKFDAVTDQPDCPSEDKAAWLKDFRSRLDQLESELAAKEAGPVLLLEDNKAS